MGSQTITHKSAVSLQSQRVSSRPGSGQDVLKRTAFAVASQAILRPQRCWLRAAEKDQNDDCEDEMNALVSS
jgi:hypothetical protein